MGKKKGIDASDEDYMTAFCVAIVDLALKALSTQKLYVALYKGITQGTGWGLGLMDNPKVLHVLDLRERSYFIHLAEAPTSYSTPRRRSSTYPPA